MPRPVKTRPYDATRRREKARENRAGILDAARRLFLADGPKAVEGALSVAGCVVEVFATPRAAERVIFVMKDGVVYKQPGTPTTASPGISRPAGVWGRCRCAS